MTVTYDIYQLVSGSGPPWGCHCRENGKSRLIFFCYTESEAKTKATDWANGNLDTPERREILRQRAKLRKKRRERGHD